jgi:hypothetical protein
MKIYAIKFIKIFSSTWRNIWYPNTGAYTDTGINLKEEPDSVTVSEDNYMYLFAILFHILLHLIFSLFWVRFLIRFAVWIGSRARGKKTKAYIAFLGQNLMSSLVRTFKRSL